MSVLVGLERGHLVYGTTTVLHDVSLGVSGGDRIGVVGRNGGGKSSLVGVLAGVRELDSGRVTWAGGPGGTTSGLLHQADTLDPEATVRQAVVADLDDHEWAGQSRVRDIIVGLLGDIDASAVGGLQAKVGPLSGGERRRVALASLLVADPEVLWLDEPTNHLDVDAIAWLADHITSQRARNDQATVVVTHDRWFLDAVATLTWEVNDGAVAAFDGGYSAYVLAKAERQRMATVTAARRDNLLRKELAWLRRGAPARTSKPKFRLEAAAALIADEPAPRDQVALARFAATRLGKDVVDLEDVSLTLGDRMLLDRVTWRLGPGDRLGIVGVNGSGKSSLLRLLAGELSVDSGRRKQGRTVALAHLTQEVTELDDLSEHTVLAAVEAVKSFVTVGGVEITASSLAKRLGFSGPRQQTRVGDLSGGERRRLQLTRLLMREPNVLLLDEPTNDLDIETLTSLEDVLDGWAGTLVVVSHDRFLLERVTDRQVALLGDGRLRDLPGGVQEYLRLLGERQAASQRPPMPVRVPAAGLLGRPPALSGPNPAQVRQARKDVARVDKALARLAEREERLYAEMAAAASDHEALRTLGESLTTIRAEREALEHEWLEAAELLG